METNKTWSAREHRRHRRGGNQYWKDMQGTPKPNNSSTRTFTCEWHGLAPPIRNEVLTKIPVDAWQGMNKRNPSRTKRIWLSGVFLPPSPDSAKHSHGAWGKADVSARLKPGALPDRDVGLDVCIDGVKGMESPGIPPLALGSPLCTTTSSLVTSSTRPEGAAGRGCPDPWHSSVPGHHRLLCKDRKSVV